MTRAFLRAFVIGVLFLCPLLCGTGLARAWGTDYTWTGEGGSDTNWTTPANWGGSGYPNSLDDTAIIRGDVAVTVTIDENITIRQLTTNRYGSEEVIVSIASGKKLIIDEKEGYSTTDDFKRKGNGKIILIDPDDKEKPNSTAKEANLIFTGGGECEAHGIDDPETGNHTVTIEEGTILSITDTLFGDMVNGTLTFTGEGTLKIPGSGANLNWVSDSTGKKYAMNYGDNLVIKPYSAPRTYNVTSNITTNYGIGFKIELGDLKYPYRAEIIGNKTNSFVFSTTSGGTTGTAIIDNSTEDLSTVQKRIEYFGTPLSGSNKSTLAEGTYYVNLESGTLSTGDGIKLTFWTPDYSMELATIIYIQGGFGWKGGDGATENERASATNINNWFGVTDMNNLKTRLAAEGLTITTGYANYPNFDGNFEIKKLEITANAHVTQSSGTLTLGALSCTGAQSYFESSGGTVTSNASTFFFSASYPENTTFNNLKLTSSTAQAVNLSTLDNAPKTLNVRGNLTVTGELTVAAENTLNLGAAGASGAVTVNGALTNNGTVTCKQDVTLYGNLTNAGTINIEEKKLKISGDLTTNTGRTFTSGSGTVEFVHPADASTSISIIKGHNTFHNLTCAAPGKTLQFEAGETQTVTGKLTITGASGGYINLESTEAGKHWVLDVTNSAAHFDVKLANVKDSRSVNGLTALTGLCTNQGNNSLWFSKQFYWMGKTDSNWGTQSNWEEDDNGARGDASLVPSSTFDIIISKPPTDSNVKCLYVDDNNVRTMPSLFIEEGAVLKVDGAKFSVEKLLRCDGTIITTGTVEDQFAVQSGGFITFGENSTIEYTGTGAAQDYVTFGTDADGNHVFPHLVFSKTGGTFTFTTSSTLPAKVKATDITVKNGATLTLGGDTTFNGGAVTVENSATFACNGHNATFAETVTNKGTLALGDGTVTFKGNLTDTGSITSATGGTAVFDGTNAQTVTLGSSAGFPSVSVTNTSTDGVTVSGALACTGSLSVTGTLSTNAAVSCGSLSVTGTLTTDAVVSCGGTLTVGDGTNAATLTAPGVTVTGITTVNNSAELVLGTSASTFTGAVTNAGTLASGTGTVTFSDVLRNTGTITGNEGAITIEKTLTNNGRFTGGAGDVTVGGNYAGGSSGTHCAFTASSGTTTFNGGTVNLAFTDFTANSGTVEFGGAAQTVTPPAQAFNNVTVANTAGTTFAASTTFLIAGNFANNGTFTAGNDSTVQFVAKTPAVADDTSTITGDNTFFNLTCTAPGKTLQFEAGKTQTIGGKLTITRGTSTSGEVTLKSTVDGTHWIIDVPANDANFEVSNVIVKDSRSVRPLVGFPGGNCTDGGNNFWWFSATYRWVGGTGSTGNSWTTPGNWRVLGADNSEDSVTAAPSTNASTISVEIATASGNLNPDISTFASSGTTLSLYSLAINAGSALKAGSCTITLTQSFVCNGTFITTGTTENQIKLAAGATGSISFGADSTIEYTGAGDAHDYVYAGTDSGNNVFPHLVFSKTAGTFTFTAPAKATDITVKSGATLTLGGETSFGGAVTVEDSATLTLGGDTTFSGGAVTVEASSVLACNGHNATFAGDLTNSGTLELGTGTAVFMSDVINGGTITGGAGTTTIGGDYTAQDTASFTASSGTTTFTGETVSFGGGNFNANSGTIVFGGTTAQTVTPPSATGAKFNAVNIANAGGVTVSGALACSGSLSVTGTLTTDAVVSCGGTLTVGDGTNAAKLTAPGVTVTGRTTVKNEAELALGGSASTFTGAVTNAGTLTGGTGTVTFSDVLINTGTITGNEGAITIEKTLTNNGRFTGGVGAITFNNVLINKGDISFSGEVTCFDAVTNETTSSAITANEAITFNKSLANTGTITAKKGVTFAGTGVTLIGDGTFASTGMVTFSGENQTFTQGSNTTLNSVTVSSRGESGLTISGSSFSCGDALRVNGKLTLSDGITLSATSGLTNNGTIVGAPSGAATLNCAVTNSRTITGGAGKLTFKNSVTNDTGGSISGGSGTLAFAGLLTNSGDFTCGTGAITLAGNLNNTGTFRGGGSLSVAGNLVNSGTLSGGTGTIKLAGNFANTGTFTAGSSTVEFVHPAGGGSSTNTSTSTITGDNTFFNLTCTAPGKTLQFEAGKTQTIGGKLTITGGSSAGEEVTLKSTVDGTHWIIDVPATAANFEVLNAIVKDSSSKTLLSTLTGNCTDGGNNFWWFSAVYRWVGSVNSEWNNEQNWKILDSSGSASAAPRAPETDNPKLGVEVMQESGGHGLNLASDVNLYSLSIDGNSTLNAGSCSIALAHSFECDGTFITTGTTENQIKLAAGATGSISFGADSTIEYTGAGDAQDYVTAGTDPDGTRVFPHLVFSKTGGTFTFDISSTASAKVNATDITVKSNLTLSGAATFLCDLTVKNSATLTLGGETSFGGAVTVEDSATLTLGGETSFGGAVTVEGSATLTLGGDTTFSGRTISIATSGTFAGNSQNVTFAGDVTFSGTCGGVNTLTVAEGATLRLGESPASAHRVINNGTLVLAGVAGQTVTAPGGKTNGTGSTVRYDNATGAVENFVWGSDYERLEIAVLFADIDRGINAGVFSAEGCDLYLRGDHTLRVAGGLSAKNFYAMNGTIDLAGHSLSVERDFAVWGARYRDDDPEYPGTDHRFAYYPETQPTGSAEGLAFPLPKKPGEPNVAEPAARFWTEGLSGASITVGGNLYVNGADILPRSGICTITVSATEPQPVPNRGASATKDQWGEPYAMFLNMRMNENVTVHGKWRDLTPDVDLTPLSMVYSLAEPGSKNLLVTFSRRVDTTGTALQDIPSALMLVDWRDCHESGNLAAHGDIVYRNSAGRDTDLIDKAVPARLMEEGENGTTLMLALKEEISLAQLLCYRLVTARNRADWSNREREYVPKLHDTSRYRVPLAVYQIDGSGNYTTTPYGRAPAAVVLDAVQPVLAYDNQMQTAGSVTGDETGVARRFDGNGGASATLSNGTDISMQVQAGEELRAVSGVRAALCVVPGSALRDALDGTADTLLTAGAMDAFTSAVAGSPYFGKLVRQGSASSNGLLTYALPNAPGAAGSGGLLGGSFALPSGTVQFFFVLVDERGQPLTNTDGEPVFVLRRPENSALYRADVWSFFLKDTVRQRGGVTILNNVINVARGEETVIEVEMTGRGSLTVQVLTLDGNVVKTLNRGVKDAGQYTFRWNGTNKNGKACARGMYFVRVTGKDLDETRKVMVVRE